MQKNPEFFLCRTHLRRLLLAVGFAFSFTALTAHAGAYDDLIKAATLGETDTVLSLVGRGMDVNTSDPEGTTVLMLAIRNDNVPLVESLLKYRPNLGRRNAVGEVALSLAAYVSDPRLVKMLLDAGAEPNQGDWRPVHYAAFRGNADILKMLVDFGAKVDARAPNQQTALMLAAREGHLPAINVLLKGGADPLQKDTEGRTAGDIAERRGHAELLSLLREAEAVAREQAEKARKIEQGAAADPAAANVAPGNGAPAAPASANPATPASAEPAASPAPVAKP